MLKKANGDVVSTLGYAKNIRPTLAYNELSTLEFEYPMVVDSKPTISYDLLVGGKVIELKDVGQFILYNPETIIKDGVTTKLCKARSLEYEATYKKIYIPSGTYNFWNPLEPENTVIGFIQEKLKSWSLDSVDSDLIGIYRFLDVTDNNVYNFIKDEVQNTYSCIFTFDTLLRKFSVKSLNSTASTKPIFISNKNLAKSIEVVENSESVFTCLTVNGAENVSIASCNPNGTDKIYNLSHFMTLDNVSQTIIDKYNLWSATYQSYLSTYYNLSIQNALLTQDLVTQQSLLKDMEGTLSSYETLRSVYISAIASGDTSQQSNLTTINATIANQKVLIDSQKQTINIIQYNLNSILDTMSDINVATSFSSFFTEEEILIIDRFIKETSIQESSFYVSTVGNYDYTVTTDTLSSVTFSVAGASVVESEIIPYPRLRTVGELDSLTLGELDSWELGAMDIDSTGTTHSLYTVTGGNITSSGGNADLSSNIIKLSLLRNSLDQSFLLSILLSNGVIYTNEFNSGCLSASGTCSTITFDSDSLSFTVTNGSLLFSEDNTSSYQKFSVESDLLAYGQKCLEALSSPSYTFTMDLANFLSLEDFVNFKNNLELGSRVYVEIGDGNVLTPYVIAVELDYSDVSKLKIVFSDTYTQRGVFDLKALLDQSISMGASLNYSKGTFASFNNSGAATALSKIKNDSLDYSKNQIISASGQGIIINDSGLSGVKWNDDHSAYEPEQFRLINNQWCFTDNSWESVKLALGRLLWNGTYLYGINAGIVYGDMVAGQNLHISSSKQYGGEAVFSVTADGVKLINSVFDSYAGNSQISINPYRGIVGGLSPLYTDNNYTVNENNAKFWLDVLTGDVNIAGDANIQGSIYAKNLYLGNGTVNVLNALNQIKGTSVDGRGLIVRNALDQITFYVDENGNLALSGNITMTGGSINWSNINETGSAAYSLASTANSTANNASSLAQNIRDGYTAIKDGNGNTLISGNYIYSPILFGNAIIIKSNALDDASSGFYIRDKIDDTDIFFIRHITNGSNKQSYIRGVSNTSMVFGEFKIGSTDYDGLGTKSQTTMRGIWKLDSDICGTTLPEHDETKPYRIFYKLPS